MITSDIQFKQNVMEEKDALRIISRLKPVIYKLKSADYPQFNFNNRLQHGFIANEVEQILPELVLESYHPGELDSLGNEVIAPTSYKSLNYTGLISVNTAAIIELNQKVEKATLSDVSLKTNVLDLDTNSLTKVLSMRGVTYSWDYANNPEMAFDSSSHIGFIAQEINQVDPLLTFVDDAGLMHVDYDKTAPIIVEAITILNNKIASKDSFINDLNARLTQLENCLSALLPTLCNMNQQAIQQNNSQSQEAIQQEFQEKVKTSLQVTLSNKNSIVLSQNVPNPFAESTVIEYSIPATVGKAQIHFYNSEGKIINSVDILERGNGELKVFANDLSSGVYTYTLVADGKVVSTKKMMKQ